MKREQALTLWNETLTELGIKGLDSVDASAAEGLKEAIVRFAEKLTGSDK